MSSTSSSIISTTFDSFLIFKRNAHYLYDIIVSHVLAFPSLTFQFVLPIQKKQLAKIPFIFTTHAQDEQNFLYRKSLQLPFNDYPQPQETVVVSDRGIFAGGYGSVNGVGEIIDEYCAEIPAEANAIALAQDNDICAISVENHICILDFTSILLNQVQKKPKLVLEGLLTECFTMVFEGFTLMVGDAAGKLILYDLKEFSGRILHQINLQSAINAIAVSPYFNDLLVVTTDAGELIFFDYELTRIKSILLGDLIEDSFVGTSLAFSRFNEEVLAIGGQNGLVVLLNIKSLEFQRLVYHTGAVYQLKFSPFYQNLLMSGSEDSRICLWDVLKLKLAFVHAGHTCCVSDCQFHPTIPNLIGSVAEDNSLQFWWPSTNCFRVE